MKVKKKSKKKSQGPTPKERKLHKQQAKDIVAAWRKAFTTSLKPLSFSQSTEPVEKALRSNIQLLLDGGDKFTAEDRRNSLRVARDCARICRILQPSGTSKKVSRDTLEAVLGVASTSHLICQSGKAQGGWCDIG